VACGFIRAALDEGWSADALKPVVSGFVEADWADSDPGRLLDALGWPLTSERLAAISPWRYRAPLAPPMAARLEAAALPIGPIIDFCRERIARSDADLMLVEGVGGLMSPLAEAATCLDLLESLACWNVLVGGAYLGAMSHTLTALEVMRMRGLGPAALVISESADPDAPDFMETVALIAAHAGEVPVIPASRSAGDAWAGLALTAALG
jgi:dethiobiotin synthetase